MVDSVPIPSSGANLPGISHIAGPLVIGELLSAGMYGLFCGQLCSSKINLYHVSFQNDKPRVKALVYLVFVLDTIQTFAGIEAALKELVYGFTDVSLLDYIGPPWFFVPIVGGTITFTEQSFYAYRIFIIGHRFRGAAVASGVIILLALGQVGGAIAIAVEMFRAKRFSLLLNHKVKLTFGLWNGGSALCDIMIAVCMTSILLASSNKDMKDTRKVVEKLVRLVLETGTLTACVAILDIVLILLPGEPPYYQIASAVLSKVYAHSILIVLNSRIRFVYGYEGARERPNHTTTLVISNDLQFAAEVESIMD